MQRTPHIDVVAGHDGVSRVCPTCGAPYARANASYVNAVLFARKWMRGSCPCMASEAKARTESGQERN